MKIKVPVQMRFEVIKSEVKGSIMVDPEMLVQSLWMSTTMDSRDEPVKLLKKAILNEKQRRLEMHNDSLDIVLENGVVERNFMFMNMEEAVALLHAYARYSDLSKNDEVFHWWAIFAFRCSLLNYGYETANVSVKEVDLDG